MLQNTKDLYDYKLTALDGDIGQVKDLYFDDKTWVIRYLVAHTESWLPGRLVLLSPHALGKLDQTAKTLHVKLHKKQIESSPAIESHMPISRQYEIAYHRYYGWPAYWNAGGMYGFGGYPVDLPPTKDEMEVHLQGHEKDRHLQSAKAITGYHIQTVDGAIGQVTGFMVDDKIWAIRELVVEAGHWYSGKEILISPGKIERISYQESEVFVNLTKADIQRTGKNEVAKAGASNH